MSILHVAADVSVPSGATTEAVILATATSSTPFAVPASWAGKFVCFTLNGAASTDFAYIRLGTTAALAAVALTASSIGAGPTYTITAGGTEPYFVLPHGVPMLYRIDAAHVFGCHIATATGGKIHCVLQTGRYGVSGA